MELALPGTERVGYCWVYRPDGYASGQRLPLLVCLHGTDDTAEQMIAFWRARQLRVPAVIAAPQGVGKGWTSDDVATIRATFEYLDRCVWHDSNRVLLAGFSAGGAMTFQMLYHEKVPVTAAAALANYVPPRLTLEEVRDRRQVPVFYAVGMADINHELMRSGLEFLRSAGATVELYRPPIGHTLDAGVGQAAIDWFFDQCERQTDAAIESAARSPQIAPASVMLEQITGQAAWYPQRQVDRARAVLKQIEEPGEQKMRTAESLLAERKAGEAADILTQIVADYGISRLGVQARERLEAIKTDPVMRQQAEHFTAGQRAEAAMAEYVRAQRLVGQRDLAEAARVCRRILEVYSDTPAAARAERLLKILDGRTTK